MYFLSEVSNIVNHLMFSLVPQFFSKYDILPKMWKNFANFGNLNWYKLNLQSNCTFKVYYYK